ncbi:glycosyltransferase involved in cell wall biosynthesis [Pelomonas saccharophila]|uniref:Glycosyltransferase involved in cell wall biosynthesis n=1 Tax=Roseateles saccharophilus TaxID=304 RepID=A0ABU1YFE5_ROSSA|nr:glycosyltransferase family 2 protein [Roseateles saccharophilus]MDR7267570.1 glycosyltransferase involved in cell wall biosynthesis [Roseateles saccharophilus]
MSTAPWLSLLFPMYRVEPWLRSCIESLKPQLDEGVELVFVDDASPDASAALVEQLLPQARLVRQPENRGVSAARNRLLDEARGDYLWFIDPDDLVEPGVIPRLKSLLQQHRPDLLTCNFRIFDDGPSTASTKPRHRHIASFDGPAHVMQEDVSQRLRGMFVYGQFHPWSKIVRRACWPARLRFPEGRVFEDMAVFPRLALHTPRHLHVAEVWIAYRQRGGSLLSSLNVKQLDDWTWSLAGLASELPALDDDARFEIAHFCARTLLRSRRRRLQLGGEALAGLQADAARFDSSSPLSRRELLVAYFRRGRWLRGLQWWRQV